MRSLGWSLFGFSGGYAKNQGKDEEELTVEVITDDKYRRPAAKIFATQEVRGRDSPAVKNDFVVVEDLTAAEDVVVRNLTDEIGEKTQERDAGDIRENERFEMWLKGAISHLVVLCACISMLQSSASTRHFHEVLAHGEVLQTIQISG